MIGRMQSIQKCKCSVSQDFELVPASLPHSPRAGGMRELFSVQAVIPYRTISRLLIIGSKRHLYVHLICTKLKWDEYSVV